MGDIQEIVAEIADGLVASGTERGLQVTAYVDQQPVVDVVAGVADPGTGRPVEPGTLFYNWSIGKGATATLVHRLVDAGSLGYDTRIADLWPEFARHGKQSITVRQVLNHSAGVPGLPADTTPEAVCSWERMIAALEDAEPWWEPGTKVGYHAYTFGYLAGEIARRASGHELGDLLDDLTTTVFPSAAFGNDLRVIAADIPAGAKVTARALARMYAGWLGEVDGARLVSAQRLAEASAESSSGPDQVYGNESRWGLGFGLGLPWDEAGSARVFGMAGAGGSWAGADPERGVAVAVTKNVLSMDFETVTTVVGAILAEVDRS
jgi:CubicO group peptidase (beta-lactamase class C family)